MCITQHSGSILPTGNVWDGAALRTPGTLSSILHVLRATSGVYVPVLLSIVLVISLAPFCRPLIILCDYAELGCSCITDDTSCR